MQSAPVTLAEAPVDLALRALVVIDGSRDRLAKIHRIEFYGASPLEQLSSFM